MEPEGDVGEHRDRLVIDPAEHRFQLARRKGGFRYEKRDCSRRRGGVGGFVADIPVDQQHPSRAELDRIVHRSAGLLDVHLTDEGSAEIAGRSRGTPRIANRLLRRVRDYAQVRADGVVSLDVAERALELYEVDEIGLDRLDRGVLERMAGPIEHLLRNAVAHGIEARAERVAAGKSETGEITLEVRQEGNEVILVFADDGAGLNFGRIRSRAIERGLLPADAQPVERELGDLILYLCSPASQPVTGAAIPIG